jgi:hypothetical protein
MISVRTKAAITATKARGTKLGANRGVKPTVKMRMQSAAARQQRASARRLISHRADSVEAHRQEVDVKRHRLFPGRPAGSR